MKRAVLTAALLSSAYFGIRYVIMAFSPAPARHGVAEGRFTPCPTTQACISSQAADPDQFVAPIPFTVSPQQALEKLLRVLAGMDRSVVVAARASYIHVEFRSHLWGFIDDVEFFIDPEASVIHLRAAARLVGINRQRIETIRQRFNAA